MVKGGTDTLTEKGIGTFTFGSDNKLASMQQERTSLENSVSSSQGINNADTEKLDVSFGIGVGSGQNSLSGQGNIIGKVASAIGFHGGGSQNSSSETTYSSGTHMTNDQVYTQATIEHLNNKYDKDYMKSHMNEVFKEANDFQASLSKTKEVDDTKTLYTGAKDVATTSYNTIKGNPEAINNTNEIMKKLKESEKK
jgi:hypothetical protein